MSDITLTNPNFGNGWQLDFKVINRVSIGNELRTVRDAQWPVIERLTIQYENLSSTDKGALYTLFVSKIGKEITLLDFEGNNWVGCITSDVVVTDNRIDNCGWAINFEFEGILQ